MFTGIITHPGNLKAKKNSLFIFEASASFLKKAKKGTSISVNGVCITAVGKKQRAFLVELMPETLQKTALSTLKIGDIVNLELPLTPASFLSGHIVQGHVDGIGRVKEITKKGNSRTLVITFPKGLKKYIAEKGSIALNGVSLTVIKSLKEVFTVGIIPFTWKNTAFKTIKTADYVNIEVDILAKYIWQKI